MCLKRNLCNHKLPDVHTSIFNASLQSKLFYWLLTFT